ncbi:hypothetical protein LTR17_014796 [Elasticomyces elasticus]|nr:hypothetical protein LTR17_014796 [Elasticomyces elasticus]
MSPPEFFVLARVVSADGALSKWKERLVALCGVSKTEPHSTSYYWGYDVDGEPDTLWGLEGYSHAVGFFLGHPASDTFKQEMRKVDDDKLLRTMQGLASPDYDLHYYDFHAGFITRSDDEEKDCKDSFVVVVHLWAQPGQREALLKSLAAVASTVEGSETGPSIKVQSFGVLKECMDTTMASLYIRARSQAQWESSNVLNEVLDTTNESMSKYEVHCSQAFNGHIDQKALIESF